MIEEGNNFVRQLLVDRDRALAKVEAESIAAAILKDLYPLLRGPLYPKGKSAEIARRLNDCVRNGHPVHLLAVLVLQTVKVELPHVVDAVKVFHRSGVNVTSTAILADWPETTTKPVKPVDAEPVEILARQNFDQVQGVRLELPDLEQLDPKLRQWLLRFYERQRSKERLERVLGFDVDYDLAMRQKIGRIISVASVSDFALGLTTERNPQLLRCYGSQIFLVNVDARKQ